MVDEFDWWKIDETHAGQDHQVPAHDHVHALDVDHGLGLEVAEAAEVVAAGVADPSLSPLLAPSPDQNLENVKSQSLKHDPVLGQP